MDDGSLDQTPCALKKVQEYFGENWIKIITLDENSGPSLARNKAWDNASGVFIAFLDADDAWKATKIEIQYNVMIHNPEYPISCHEWHLAADREIEEQKTADTVQNYPVKTMSILSVLMSNRLNTSSVMLRSDIQHRFCIEKRHSEDYLLWMEILLAENAKALMINRPLVVHFKSPFSSGGQSADLCKMEMEELNNFKRIFKTGKIPCGIVILAMMFSCIKYLRRLLIVKFSNAR